MTDDESGPELWKNWTETDAVLACADLVSRGGAASFEVGLREQDRTTWYAEARYKQGTMVGEGATPEAAATALAGRLFSGARCKCGQPVSLPGTPPGCRWRLVGKRWEPGCTAPSIDLPEEAGGDLDAVQGALKVTGLNQPYRVESGIDRMPPFDPHSADHLWIVIVTFRILDPVAFHQQPDGPALLDRENLVITSPVMCFHCEEMYTPRLSHRRCRGKGKGEQ